MQLWVEGFDVSVGGRALDDDEGVVSLEENASLDVVPNTRALSVRALREAGREVSEDGLLEAGLKGNVSLVTLYLDAGVPLDCVNFHCDTPLHRSCARGYVEVARLLLDRGSTAIGEKNREGNTPLHHACCYGHLSVVRLLLDRGAAIAEKNRRGHTPLFYARHSGNKEVIRLLQHCDA